EPVELIDQLRVRDIGGGSETAPNHCDASRAATKVSSPSAVGATRALLADEGDAIRPRARPGWDRRQQQDREQDEMEGAPHGLGEQVQPARPAKSLLSQDLDDIWWLRSTPNPTVALVTAARPAADLTSPWVGP